MINFSSDYFVLRTPQFNFKAIDNSSISQIISNDSFIESLLISSPGLVSEIPKYTNGLLSAKDKEKFELSIYKYYLRASYRCTPFGSFAGISIGSFSNLTEVQFADETYFKKNTRPDTHFLSSFVQQMTENNAIRKTIKWFTNNTFYLIGDKIRYVEFKVSGGVRTHQLAAVEQSEYLILVLETAKTGRTIGELSKLLVNEDIVIEEAEGFINEMINSCLLVCEFEPHVTGIEYHSQLLDKLKNREPCKDYYYKLQSILKVMKEADTKGIGTLLEDYTETVDDLKRTQNGFDQSMFIQSDLFKPTAKCQVSHNIIDELNKTISFLDRITSIVDRPNLKKFKEAFEKQYESEEIPLLVVLDADVGIGYPVNEQTYLDNSPLLNNLNLHFQKPDEVLPKFDRWSKFIFTKYLTAIDNRSIEIDLKDEDLGAFFKVESDIPNRLPNSAYSICNVLSESSEELDKGNFMIYHDGTSGPSAGDLIGRFCFMDHQLKDLTIKAIKKEETFDTDCIYAEIVHIPQSRLGNVSMRPVLREYEIPILTFPTVDQEHTIPLSDLMVSVKNGKILLRSKRLGRQVIPRLTTAHNFSLSTVSYYYFLCELQYQDTKGYLSWNWGLLKELPFLPRIRYNKTILSKATWRISVENLTKEKNVSNSELGTLIKIYFEKNNLPNSVTISQGDNQLLINIENDYCLRILSSELKKYRNLELKECLFNSSNLFVNGAGGGYTNELIIPLTKNIGQTLTNTSHQSVLDSVAAKRMFLPGSEWYFVKIYCGVKTADKVLVDVVKPLIDELFAQGKILKWFFIRYADPDHHIRIRFFGEGNFYARVTKMLNTALAPYVESNLIRKVQTDTYNRELERYGATNMENSETVFFFDSLATLQILSLLEGDEGDDLRWQFAIKGVNDLLDAFQYATCTKRNLMSWLSTNFANEFKFESQESKKQLGAKYRECRPAIDSVLRKSVDAENEWYEVWDIFKQRYESISQCASEILKLSAENKLSVGLNDLVASYIHMFLNRFLRSKQRMQEMIIYDMLHQHYKSELARQNKATGQSQSQLQ
jgi:lantibiotic biosynthesis protein